MGLTVEFEGGHIAQVVKAEGKAVTVKLELPGVNSGGIAALMEVQNLGPARIVFESSQGDLPFEPDEGGTEPFIDPDEDAEVG